MANFIGVPAVYPKLLEIRKSTTAEFRPSKYWNPDMKLRYYQVIGALHMMLLERMVLGDATGIGKCVSDDTYVPTSKGFMKIGSLLPPLVQEDTFHKSPKLDILSSIGAMSPSALYDSGIKQGLRITTDNGYSLLGLRHHPILCSSKEGGTDYKTLETLTLGDHVCINRKGIFSTELFRLTPSTIKHINSRSYTIPEYLTDSLAELIGFYVSEGNSNRDQSFTIEQHEHENNARIRYLLKDVFGYEENDSVKSHTKTVKIHSVLIRDCLENTGLNMLAISGDKEIPEGILRSPKSVIRSFLRGYFEGDGGVEKGTGTVSCSSKSERLINQLQQLLLMFGIVSKRKEKMVKINEGGERRPYWVLYFLGKSVDVFKSEIGFVSMRKTLELDQISQKTRNTNKDTIPNGHVLLKKSMQDIIEHLKNLPSQKGFSTKGSGWKGIVGYKNKRKFEAVIFNRRRLTYPCLNSFINLIESNDLQKVVTNYTTLKQVYSDHYYFDEVISTSLEAARFVDFTVPEIHNFTGNGFINHNTAQTLAAYSFLLERDPGLKLLVVCTKSALGQWAEEIQKFMIGVTSRIITTEYQGLTGYNARKLQYQSFKEHVMIMNYAPIIEEYEAIREAMGSNFMIVFDEVTAVKNRKAKTHVSAAFLSQGARRVYGLSATIIKNGLEEVYGIYDIVVPGLFGKITNFKDKFCQQKMMKLMINGKMRYIPKITGYKNLEEFRTRLDPYFLIRRKEEVAKELPRLISKKIILEMYPEQKELYKQALAGIIYEERVKQDFYEISDKMRLGAADKPTLEKYKVLKEKYDKFLTTEGKKRGKLAALTYCQMISNSPALVNQPGESSKDDEFIRLIKEELAGEKVIVFTRFKSGIPGLEVLCERNALKYTKITGDCNDRERDEARIKFQTSKDCNIIFITTAGSMSLNLQAASSMIFIDTPWSYGDLVQLIGRAQRIGSIQEHILLIHLVNKGSIDLRVMNRVSNKKDLSDEILGDTAKGALDFTQHDDDAVDSLFSDIMEDAQVFAKAA